MKKLISIPRPEPLHRARRLPESDRLALMARPKLKRTKTFKKSLKEFLNPEEIEVKS